MNEGINLPLFGAKNVPLPKQKLNLQVSKEGFHLECKGYGENFILQLVAQLQGQVTSSYEPSVFNPESMKHDEPCECTLEEEKVAVEDVRPLKKNPPMFLSDKFGEKSKDLYEVAGVEHTTPDHDYFHTGIKFDNLNRPKYRCAYECPKCGESGRHYIPLHISRVSCHGCQTSLIVDPATDNGLGTEEEHRDANGNFTVARTIDYSFTRSV